MSRKHFRSILDEISSLIPEQDKHSIIENRAGHIITSAINMMEIISENFSEEEAEDLSRKFILAIRKKNPNKFHQGIKKLRENKNDRSK